LCFQQYSALNQPSASCIDGMASFSSPARPNRSKASYRDMLLHRKLQELSLHHTRCSDRRGVASSDSFAGAPAPASMANSPGSHHMARQASGDTEFSDDELLSMLLAGRQPAELHDGGCQQQSTSAPIISSLSQQQQAGDTSLDCNMGERFNFSGSEDANNAVDATIFSIMSQDGGDTPAAAGTFVGLQPLSAQNICQNTADSLAAQPARWHNPSAFPVSTVPPAAAGSPMSAANAAALAVPCLAQSGIGNSSSINCSRQVSPTRSHFSPSGNPYGMDTTVETSFGYGNGTGSMSDGTGRTSYASFARTSNSNMLADMPAAAMCGSSSSCCVMDMDAAPLPSPADLAWQPSSSMAAAGVSDADMDLVRQVLALATKFKLDPAKCLELCVRAPIVTPECAIQIYQSCLSDVDAAVAACMVGFGGLFISDASAAAATGRANSCMIEFESIFDGVGDESAGAVPSAVALAKADSLHQQAKAAYAEANGIARSAASCGIYSKKKELELSADEAKQCAASLYADAHAAAYTAHNGTLNYWHVDLCGLSAADATSTFTAQLGHIADLEYPGGMLMCVALARPATIQSSRRCHLSNACCPALWREVV
jgi:hypothetical protein